MGSHYGVKIRSRETKVIKQQKAKYICPACMKTHLRRVDTSLWQCTSCGTKLAGGAYQPETEVGATARKTLNSVK